ncbi:hypothetical protein MBLNU457_g2516t1 [Dothideomycetes sp. NU457]
MAGGIIAQPLGPQGLGFNWVFLVEILLCGFLALFFIFYFNRTFATIISYGVRAWTWHKYRVYIDITSLQISLLGGRIFFKTIRYHGRNETILIHDGRVTWRYWLRKVQEPEIFEDGPVDHPGEGSESTEEQDEKKSNLSRKQSHGEEGGIRQKQTTLPSRFHVRVSGVEAFLYNHTPAYDAILDGVRGTAGPDHSHASSGASEKPSSPVTPMTSGGEHEGSDLDIEKTRSSGYTFSRRNTAVSTPQVPAFLHLFPVQVECKKAAAAVGSEHTTSVVVAKVQNANGRIDAGKSGPLDIFKILFNFAITDVSVSLKPNQDFKEYQLQAAQRLEQGGTRKDRKMKRKLPGLKFLGYLKMKISKAISMFHISSKSSARSVRTASIASDADTMPAAHKSPADDNHDWHGLARFLDDDQPTAYGSEWETVEYARFSTIAEIPKVEMCFYWDIPGTVPDKVDEILSSADLTEDINGAVPPAYGMNLSVYGGNVHYGPWADRQRIVLQNMFFPAPFITNKPHEKLRPGDTRLATVFKVHVCVEEEITLRIPTREPSKDWKWQSAARPETSKPTPGPRKRKNRDSGRQRSNQKRRQAAVGVDTRPFAWMDVTVKRDSVINYNMDFYPGQHGFKNSLDVDVKGTEITSSVNHGLLWRAGNLTLKGDLSNPLQWNALRNWTFDIVCHDLDLFILRDHMFLIIDLVGDWSTGPPPEFFTFVPFKYNLKMVFKNFKMFLNSNDANVINNPSDLNDNSFLVLKGETLQGDLGIPIDQYRPAKSMITFDVIADHMALDLHTPRRQTLHELLHEKEVARLPALTLKGSHTFLAEQSTQLTDTLQMEICGSGLVLYANGYLVRHFINVKENYFGEFLHFKTLEEFQAGEPNPIASVDEEVERYRFRANNELDVILTIIVPQPAIILPTNLYSAGNYIRIDVPSADVDLRVASYYLDLQTNVGPLSISFLEGREDGDDLLSKEQIHINGAEITGHRLFGLPPTEQAYVSNWDIGVGSLTGECSASFLHQLVKAGTAFAFAFADFENAVPLAEPLPIYDITFVRVRTELLDLCLTVDGKSTRLSCDPVYVQVNDAVEDHFSSQISIRAPNLTLTCSELPQAQHIRASIRPPTPDTCLAFLQTTVDLTVLKRDKDFSMVKDKQREHIQRQDSRTHRATFLGQKSDGPSFEGFNDSAIGPPAMFVPRLASPITSAGQNVIEDVSTSEVHAARPPPPLPEAPDTSRRNPSQINTFGLTSAYAIPLLSARSSGLDMKDVPKFGTIDEEDSEDDNETFEEQIQSLNLDEDVPHTSLIIRLDPGVRALLRPGVTDVAFAIMSEMIPTRPEDVYDAFQINVLGNVTSALDEKRGRGQVIDVRLVVPSVDLRILIEPEQVSTPDADQSYQQIDLSLGYSTLTVRSQSPSSITGSEGTVIAHTALASLALELSSRLPDRPKELGGIRIEIEDVLFWLSFGKTRVVNVNFRVFTTLLSARKADFLAPIIVRFFTMITSAIEKSNYHSEKAVARTRHLVHYIAINHEGMAEPPHVGRMTYILRAFPDHFRNQDSWKIVARLRFALDHILANRERDILDDMAKWQKEPVKAKDIQEDWGNWYAWDVPHLEGTQAFQTLFPEQRPASDPAVACPMHLILQAGVLRLLIGSYENASEVAVAELILDVNVQPPTSPSGLMLVEENLRTLTTVQAKSTAIYARLKWDLIPLVEPIVQAFKEQIEPLTISPNDRSPYKVQPETDTAESRHDLHVVLFTKTGSVIVDTVNVQHIAATQNLKVSVIGTSHAAKTYRECVCVLANANQATTELRSIRGERDRIWKTVLSKPSIYVDYRKLLDKDAAEINVGGSYTNLEISIEQEILRLVPLVDSILADEVMQIRELQEKFRKIEDDIELEHPGGVTTTPELMINIALLAGSYSVDCQVLKSLSINIQGETASLRVAPTKEETPSLKIELEIGAIRFAAISKESGLIGQEALFYTPSVGLSCQLQFTEGQVDLNMSGVVQEMKVEAAALQNIFVVFKKPEVQSALDQLRDSIADVQKTANHVLQHDLPKHVQTASKGQTAVFYDVNLTFVGFKIFAKAPVPESKGTQAELVLGFGLVHAVVDNTKADTEHAGDIPSIYVRLDSVFATLELLRKRNRTPCGHIKVGALLRITPTEDVGSHVLQDITASSEMLDIEVSAATASTMVDVVTHIQKKIVDLDLSTEVAHLRKLRHPHHKRDKQKHNEGNHSKDVTKGASPAAFGISNVSVNLNRIRLAWIVGQGQTTPAVYEPENLEFTLAHVEFSLKEQQKGRLTIQNIQLQMIGPDMDSFERSLNSALLPEVIFTVTFESGPEGLRLAFQAVGQMLDLRLDSSFVGPMSNLVQSGQDAIDNYTEAAKNWKTWSSSQDVTRQNPFGDKKLLSVLVDMNFAGAILYLQGQAPRTTRLGSQETHGRHGSISSQPDGYLSTTLKAPGVAMKFEYLAENDEDNQSALQGEMKIQASSNTVYPELVPIILQISDYAKEAMRESEKKKKQAPAPPKAPVQPAEDKATSRLMPSENILDTNPILAKMRVSFGLRICRQEFGLSCQPIARVNAKVLIDDIYITLNTVDPETNERFLALSAAFTTFSANVQHVYSRESTFAFDVESVVFSVMNSKHLEAGGITGLSTVLKINPMKTSVNARQLQDLMLFREIWMPQNILDQRATPVMSPADEQSEELLVQRYRQVATATAFPWNATLALEDLEVNVDFGQSIGKASVNLHGLWVSSTKTSGWKQDLCLGIDKIYASSVGRMGGFVDLAELEARTSIEWPSQAEVGQETPLIQATARFSRLQVKASFDYQPFAFADIEDFSFLMFNVREREKGKPDRLVAVLDGGKVYAFCTATSPAQAVGLVQAFERLIQEKQAAYKQSLQDLEKQMHRPSTNATYSMQNIHAAVSASEDKESNRLPIRLRTDVLLSIRAISVGAFPSTFLDNQIFKLEAMDVEAGFLVDISDSKIQGNLSMVLGQLQVALSNVKKIKIPKTLGDVAAEEVIENAVASKGGVIARVPRVVASMQTWQEPGTKTIDYIFKSAFEGKVDIGWNYSRISYIRGMWETHSRSLAARIGKPLPTSAVKITAEQEQGGGGRGKGQGPSATVAGGEQKDGRGAGAEHGKITAVVNMPLSKYEYRALEPPIVETPQLRDMGEATPPLEWIGLHRERLPNVVHQVVIVTLLEVAKEVEDAYGRILGAS